MKRFLLLLFACISILAQDGAYEFILFGDIHYDNLDCHENEKLKPYQLREQKRNLEHWKPGGLAERMLKAGSTKINPSTAFVVQVGDITQGDAKSLDAQKQLFREISERFKGLFGELPFYYVKGNHDHRSPGGAKAFAEESVPFLKTQLPKDSPIRNSNYSFARGKDLFVFIDCQQPDFELVKNAIENHKDTRHLFVFSHYPAVGYPTDCRGWVLFGTGKNNQKRLNLVDLLYKKNAIMIFGHVHTNSLTEFSDNDKRITQISIHSMDANPKHKNFPNPATNFMHGGLKKAMEDKPPLAKFINEFAPKVKDHKRFGGSGFAIVKIDGNKVAYDLYWTDQADKPSISWNLRD